MSFQSEMRNRCESASQPLFHPHLSTSQPPPEFSDISSYMLTLALKLLAHLDFHKQSFAGVLAAPKPGVAFKLLYVSLCYSSCHQRGFSPLTASGAKQDLGMTIPHCEWLFPEGDSLTRFLLASVGLTCYSPTFSSS